MPQSESQPTFNFDNHVWEHAVQIGQFDAQEFARIAQLESLLQDYYLMNIGQLPNYTTDLGNLSAEFLRGDTPTHWLLHTRARPFSDRTIYYLECSRTPTQRQTLAKFEYNFLKIGSLTLPPSPRVPRALEKLIGIPKEAFNPTSTPNAEKQPTQDEYVSLLRTTDMIDDDETTGYTSEMIKKVLEELRQSFRLQGVIDSLHLQAGRDLETLPEDWLSFPQLLPTTKFGL